MNYRSRTKRQGGKRLLFTALLLLLLSFLAPVRGMLENVLFSLAGTFNGIPFVSYFTSKEALIEENRRLQASLDTMIAERADQSILAGRTTLSEGDVLLRIVKKPGFGPYDTVVLRNDTETEIVAGERLFAGNIIVGQVASVEGNIVRGSLYSTPGNILEGSVGASTTPIEIRGVGGGGFEATVPLGLEIEVGNPVFASDIEKPFGFVSLVDTLAEEGFERILFSLPVNVNELTHLSVKR